MNLLLLFSFPHRWRRDERRENLLLTRAEERETQALNNINMRKCRWAAPSDRIWRDEEHNVIRGASQVATLFSEKPWRLTTKPPRVVLSFRISRYCLDVGTKTDEGANSSMTQHWRRLKSVWVEIRFRFLGNVFNEQNLIMWRKTQNRRWKCCFAEIIASSGVFWGKSLRNFNQMLSDEKLNEWITRG